MFLLNICIFIALDLFFIYISTCIYSTRKKILLTFNYICCTKNLPLPYLHIYCTRTNALLRSSHLLLLKSFCNISSNLLHLQFSCPIPPYRYIYIYTTKDLPAKYLHIYPNKTSF